jgi:hypothetical protein
MECSDWLNGIRYHTFDTRSDTEFKASGRAGYTRYSMGKHSEAWTG